MGADGGINWVRVLDPAKFKQLVGPLCLLWDGSHSYDHYHYRYLESNPLPKDYAVSRYSNLPGWNNGLEDLREILADIRYWIEEREKNPNYYDPYFGTGDLLAMTWKEILEEYYTHPDTTHWCIPRLVKLLVEEYGFSFTRDTSRMNTEFFGMKVGDWYRDVVTCIDATTFGSAETWT